MTDMTAFERQVAGEMLDRAGPVRPVDDLAVFDAVIAASRSHRWGFTMFSALKFVAAGAIVALFGGFLLSGLLTEPQGDDMAPAAVTASPSPMSTDELLSGMVTEEVEPGVIRVVNDGYRDLSYPNVGYPGYTVDVTPDGSVWLSDDEGNQGLFRLGEEAVFEEPSRWPPYLEVAPDGSLWAFGEVSDWGDDIQSGWEDGIFSFDGEGWTLRATKTDDTLGFQALAIGPDGTVWVAAMDQDKHCPDIGGGNCIGTTLLRLEDDGSLTTIEDWADIFDGDVAYDEVAVSPDGDVWLIGGGVGFPAAEVLLRFDGEGWEVIPGPEGFLNAEVGRSIGFGPDGTLWAHTSYPVDDDWDVGGLARFDDPGWTMFTEADGVKPWGGLGWFYTDLITVAPDGSLWLNGRSTGGGCDGVDHYDGTTWTSYLRDSCVHDLAIAPDGSVWLRAGADDRVYTYVIRPEAGVTTE